ncbi:MAG: arylamine N-acetyltransferase, partial [Ruminococcus sp.]|nr:arylamine N-acetyltransferase [Ruminococcus sp.]
GWQTINGKTYYFKKSASSTTPKGAMIKGYITISGKKYYFSSKGVLQKGKIVGTKSKGYYYADEDGICVTSSEIKYAVDFVMSHSDSGDSASERLKSCYDYLYLNYTYTRSYYAPDASNMSDEAVIMFENKSGNCYKYAAAFACIAKVLGYDSQVATGQVSAVNGGTTPHAVTRVKVDGTWYICDSQLQASYHQRAFYMTTESKYPTTYLKLDTFYTLTISEGKVTWK